MKNKIKSLLLVTLMLSSSTIANATTKYVIAPTPVTYGVKSQKQSKYANRSVIQNSVNKEIMTKTASEMLEEYDMKPLMKSWQTMKAYNLVNLVGEKLLVSSDINETIVFSVLQSKSVNAVTDVHNQITLYTSILKYVETEDELAAIIAHEIGHGVHKDVMKKVARTIAVAGAAVGTVAYGGNNGAAAATVAGGVINTKMNIKAELRADATGIDLLVNAGYNPLAMISILNKISTSHYGRSLTHPVTAERLKADFLYIKENYPQYIDDGYPTISYQMALKVIGSYKNW